jgi:hypothetical protein
VGASPSNQRTPPIRNAMAKAPAKQATVVRAAVMESTMHPPEEAITMAPRNSRPQREARRAVLRAMTPDEYYAGEGNSRVQFICGAVLGLVGGLLLACRCAHSFFPGALIVLGTTGLCAFLAWRWGDRFWEGLIRASRRLWW